MSEPKLNLYPFQEAALKEMMDLERTRMQQVGALNRQITNTATDVAIHQRGSDGRGHGNGYGAAPGYGCANGYGATGSRPYGYMADGEVRNGHGRFEEGGAFIWSGMRPTDRVFRCPGCVGGFECPVHGRRL